MDLLDGAVYHFQLWPSAFNLFPPSLEPIYVGSLTLLVYWLILFTMYKNKLFLRI